MAIPYPNRTKKAAARFRSDGYSIKEVSQKLGISQSTSSLWLKGAFLDAKALERLRQRRILGYKKSAHWWRVKKNAEDIEHQNFAKSVLAKITANPAHFVLLASILLWCEGGKKEKATLRLINSDPKLISLFLYSMRNALHLDEKKFRAALHLHEYHKETEQKLFWSKITNIPLQQFRASYFKPHTGKRIRNDYPGCITIIYHDALIFRKLKAVYNLLPEYMGV